MSALQSGARPMINPVSSMLRAFADWMDASAAAVQRTELNTITILERLNTMSDNIAQMAADEAAIKTAFETQKTMIAQLQAAAAAEPATPPALQAQIDALHALAQSVAPTPAQTQTPATDPAASANPSTTTPAAAPPSNLNSAPLLGAPGLTQPSAAPDAPKS